MRHKLPKVVAKEHHLGEGAKKPKSTEGHSNRSRSDKEALTLCTASHLDSSSVTSLVVISTTDDKHHHRFDVLHT